MRAAGSLLLLMLMLAGAVPLHAQGEESDAGDTLRTGTEATPYAIPRRFTRLAGGNRGLTIDSSAILIRRAAPGRLKRFTDDDDFRYDRKPRDPETFWEKIIDWLRRLLFGRNRKPGSRSGSNSFWDIFSYWPLDVALGLVLLFVVVSSGGIQGAFFRSSKVKLAFTEVDENIETMDFDALIDDAVAGRNFKRAVRLHYLKLLKEMGGRKIITLRREKTNHDYLRELSVPELRDPFARVTLLFEYVWYGDQPVDEPTFRRLREVFAGFDARLREVA